MIICNLTFKDCPCLSNSGILVLSDFKSSNKPMIVDLAGNLINDLSFEYGKETATFNGCGATLYGEFWYFGGGLPNTNTYKRQVCYSKVSSQNFS